MLVAKQEFCCICGVPLEDGFCPVCKIYPLEDETCIRFKCPSCDVKIEYIEEGFYVCPQCEERVAKMDILGMLKKNVGSGKEVLIVTPRHLLISRKIEKVFEEGDLVILKPTKHLSISLISSVEEAMGKKSERSFNK